MRSRLSSLYSRSMHAILPIRHDPHLRLSPPSSLTLCDLPRHEAARSLRRRALTINRALLRLHTRDGLLYRRHSQCYRASYPDTSPPKAVVHVYTHGHVPAIYPPSQGSGRKQECCTIRTMWTPARIGCGRSPSSNRVDLKAPAWIWIDLLRVCAVELHCTPIRLLILILDTCLLTCQFVRD